MLHTIFLAPPDGRVDVTAARKRQSVTLRVSALEVER